MSAHFSSFTADAMQAFGQEMAADFQRRAEFLKSTRDHTANMLANFRRDHQEAAARRREGAERDADGRRLFMSEMRSGVHALLGRFELSRKEMAADLQEMAGELRAASDAFRRRPGRHGDRFLGRAQQPKRTQPNLNGQAFPSRADAEGSGNPRSRDEGKSRHSKRRHG
jgi:hypothetical protein